MVSDSFRRDDPARSARFYSRSGGAVTFFRLREKAAQGAEYLTLQMHI